MVFLEHGRVIEAEAMVEATAAAHRVFLQQPQPRRGLAGVGQAHARARQLGHEGGGGGGDAGEAHGQVQGGAFARHQGRCRPIELQQALARLHLLALGHQQPHLHLPIEQPEQRLHQHSPTKDTGLLGNPVGAGGLAHQGRGREVTAPQVFSQPGGELGLQLWGDRQQGGGHRAVTRD